MYGFFVFHCFIQIGLNWLPYPKSNYLPFTFIMIGTILFSLQRNQTDDTVEILMPTLYIHTLTAAHGLKSHDSVVTLVWFYTIYFLYPLNFIADLSNSSWSSLVDIVTVLLFWQVEEALSEVDFQLKLDLHFTDNEQQYVKPSATYSLFSGTFLFTFSPSLLLSPLPHMSCQLWEALS